MSGMVDKLSKLLNQAERAEEGSPEREAFMTKAMELSQAYSIDLAVARAHQAKKERVEQPEKRSFKVGQSGPRKEGKNAHFVDLMIAICDANDIEVTISYSNVFVHGWGMPSDLDMAERLFAILSVQMVQEADAQLKAGANGEVQRVVKKVREEIPEDERAWGQHDGSDSYVDSCYYDERDEELYERHDGTMERLRWSNRTYQDEWVKSYPPPKFRNVPVLDEDGFEVYEEKWVSLTDARIWRVNFYAGFVTRTRVRLREAKKTALKDAGIDVADDSDTRALALRDKKKEVRDAYEEANRFVLATGGSYTGASVSRVDYGGRAAGDAAGQRARLGNEKDLPQ